jgi:hypothetical protein
MDPRAQTYLAQSITAAREGPPPLVVDPDEWRSRTLGSFSSALGALVAVGAVSQDETADWSNRMLVALGHEPLEPLPSLPGSNSVRLVSFGGQRPPRPPDPPPASTFLGLVPVYEPDRPLAYGGRLQVLGVELYSDKITVNWRLAPEPDYEMVFASELAEQETDLEGLPESHRQHLRKQLIQRLQMRRRFVRLGDDIGTEYVPRGGGTSGGGNEKRGHTDFLPGVPEGVKQLAVTWDDDVRFDVQLPD